MNYVSIVREMTSALTINNVKSTKNDRIEIIRTLIKLAGCNDVLQYIFEYLDYSMYKSLYYVICKLYEIVQITKKPTAKLEILEGMPWTSFPPIILDLQIHGVWKQYTQIEITLKINSSEQTPKNILPNKKEISDTNNKKSYLLYYCDDSNKQYCNIAHTSQHHKNIKCKQLNKRKMYYKQHKKQQEKLLRNEISYKESLYKNYEDTEYDPCEYLMNYYEHFFRCYDIFDW